MSRNLIIGLVVAAVVVVGGGAAYMLTQDDDSDNQQQLSQDSSGADNSAFNPASTEGLEFSATITVEGAPTATFEHDDQGTTRYVTTTGGQEMEIIYTSDAYYSCQDDNCIKFPISQLGNSGFNPGDYTYDEDRLGSFASPAYKGQQSCESGTCDVWEVSTGGVTSTLYVDSNTKRITKVQGTVAGKTSTIVYDYKDVTINIPQNAQTITTPTP
jgi:hypothetical protein